MALWYEWFRGNASYIYSFIYATFMNLAFRIEVIAKLIHTLPLFQQLTVYGTLVMMVYFLIESYIEKSKRKLMESKGDSSTSTEAKKNK